MEDKTPCLNNNSFIPALSECERWLDFLIKRFDLTLKDGFVVTINKTKKDTLGFFQSKECKDKYINETEDINNINLNTLNIKKSSPYEVLTHELAHLLNYNEGIKDCSSNQYHNKKFKVMAESLCLIVTKSDKRGYSVTSESEEFKTMLGEFKPNDKAFLICQDMSKKKPVGSRMRLFICSCGYKVRCAKDLNATCNECDSKFEEVL